MSEEGAGREVCAWIVFISGSPWRAWSFAHGILTNGSWH